MADETAGLGLAGMTKRQTGVAKAVEHRMYFFNGSDEATSALAAGTNKFVFFTGFPGCVVSDISVSVDDLDTGATPAVVLKVVKRAEDGTETDVEDSFTSGQAGGTFTVSKANTPIYLSGGSLLLEASTAAQVAAAGTVTSQVKAWYGRITGTGFTKNS